MKKIVCRQCRIRQGIVDYINSTSPAFLEYRPIGRFIGEKYPQTVKHHIEKMAEEGIIKIIKNDCGHGSHLIFNPAND